MTSLLWLAHLHHKKICCSRYSSFMFDLFCTTHAGCHRSNATWQICLSLDRLHVCTLFTDLRHYKLLLSRRVLESICWLSTFAKTLKTNRVLMSATHLKNPRFWVLYLSVPIFILPLVFCFSEHTQWYKVKSWADSFTQITVFCHSNLELLPLFTRVWERSNYNPGQTPLGQYYEYFFFMCRFYSWRRTQYSFTRMGKERVKFSKILISLTRCIILLSL